MAAYLRLTSSNPLGTFQTGCVAEAKKAFYSKSEAFYLPKIRRLMLRKSYKLMPSVNFTWKKTDSYQSCHVWNAWGWGWYPHSACAHRDISFGAGTGAVKNVCTSPSLFSRTLQDRGGCKAFSSRMSIDIFDKTQEKEISKQELSWKKTYKFELVSKSVELIGTRFYWLIRHSDWNYSIRQHKMKLKVPMPHFQQWFRCLSSCSSMKVLA